jgi:hypothetical protein
MIPKKSEIIEKAIEMWRLDQIKHGCGQLAEITPEYNELLESGYISSAKSELMRDSYRNIENTKDFYDFPTPFSFDIELGLRHGTFIAGSRGSGKSSLGKTIADMFLKKDYIIRVFDNSQTWRRSNIPNVVIIKPYSNFEPNYNESYVFDTSLLDIPQQKAFIENIVNREFNHTAMLSENERNWRIYVFEECELLLGTHEHSKKIMKVCALGRNLRMSYIAIAQRFQLVSTNLISLSGQLYIGSMHEQNDLKKIKNWLGDRTEDLKTLEVGEFIRYSNGKLDKMQTELFTPNIEPKMIIADPNPIEPLKPILSDSKVAVNFVAFLLWLSALLYAISHFGGF